MKLGVPKETFPGERRVAIVPAVLPALKKLGIDVVVERGAGEEAGFPDVGVRATRRRSRSRADVFQADIVAQVRAPGANPAHGAADVALMRTGQVVIGFAEPLTAPDAARAVAERGAIARSRWSSCRASRARRAWTRSRRWPPSPATRRCCSRPTTLPRMFPMLNTAAGTVAAARVFVIGAGVAGLQAIATARRLGARVEAYDVRPAVKEQIQSLGARFVEMPIEAGDAQDAGGYAKAQDESFYRRQREMMLKTVAGDATSSSPPRAIPGKKAPILDHRRDGQGDAAGIGRSSIWRPRRGGNCELTRPDEVVVRHGVTIIGPTNLPAIVPYHASQMYARNVMTLVQHLVQREKGADGKPTGPPQLVLDPDGRDHEGDPGDERRRRRASARCGEAVG